MAQFTTKAVDLFGGAITAHVPENFRDASDFREVPDTQEVYVSMTDETDISIIVDIARRVDATDDVAALRAHWEDVVQDAGRSNKVFATERVALANMPDRPAYRILGTVSARATDIPTDPPLFTALLMTVLRLEQQSTDIVVTVNVPFTSPNVVRQEGTIASPVYRGVLSGTKGPLLDVAMQVRDVVLGSLKIIDWGLFLPDED